MSKLFYLTLFYHSVSGAGSNFCRMGTLLDVKEHHNCATPRMLDLNTINKTKTILKAINEFGTVGIVCAANCQRTK